MFGITGMTGSVTSRCSNPQVAAVDCLANGFHFIPVPRILLDLDLNPATAGDRIAGEPALANGRVYVATSGSPGTVYMVEPQ